MELLSPAGNLEKMNTAFAYGADAVYIGLPGFSLRAGAETWNTEQLQALPDSLKHWNSIRPRKIYCAVNRYLHQKNINDLAKLADLLGDIPIDAFIISDLGFVPTLKSVFPRSELHLSTQANCTNSAAARMYQDMGFSRIVAARELSLEEISEIKASVPEMEIEAFVHGAVCIAYSGRCLISSWLTGRSANHGTCTHSCRWQYREFEEKKRPGNPLRVEEQDGYSTIFSPEDMCMINHIDDLRSAGVDSLKIEGRMKSAYYAAVVTQAYRHAMNHSAGNDSANEMSRRLLFELPHRGYSTGMYFGAPEVFMPRSDTSPRFAGLILHQKAHGQFEVLIKNKFSVTDPVEMITPEGECSDIDGIQFFDSDGNPTEQLIHGNTYTATSPRKLTPYSILRTVSTATQPGAQDDDDAAI